jgi:DNA-binding NtrC family response regulator
MAKLNAHVVVVDDEIDIRELVQEMLIDEIEKITVCSSVAEVFQILSLGPVDLVISDILMPEMDGISFLKELRIKKFNTGVVFISGSNDLKVLEKALALGAADFIEKPFKNENLVATVRKHAQVGMMQNKKS